MKGEHGLLIEEIERAVEDGDIELSAWEDEFITSILPRVTLTDKQDEILERIWKKAKGQ